MKKTKKEIKDMINTLWRYIQEDKSDAERNDARCELIDRIARNNYYVPVWVEETLQITAI